MPHRTLFGAGLCALAMSAGCQTPSDTTAPTDQTRQALSHEQQSSSERQSIGWDQLKYTPQGFDQLAEGPSAVAVGSDGAVLVLDRLAGRIMTVGRDGELRELAVVDEDAEDVAVGPDGAVVAYSPLRAKAWIFEPTGAPAGEVDVPRAFQDVNGIGLDASRVVRIHTNHQETFTVGSPNAPLPLPVAMRTKREGAYQLADGRGVVVIAKGGRGRLALLQQPRGRERTVTLAEHDIAGDVTAARVVGVSEDVACLRVESVSSTPRIRVSRRAVCMRATTGEVTLDVALPSKGAYLPRRELAMNGTDLVHIEPTAKGLNVRRYNVDGKEGAR